MPTFQAKNVNTVTAATPDNAGEVYTQLVQFPITAAYAATDVIEMAVLPARTKLVGVDLLTSGIAAVATVDVGFLTGEYGDKVTARTGDAVILGAAAKNAAASATIATLFGIAATEVDRGIGVKLSAAEAAGVGIITLKLSYQAA